VAVPCGLCPSSADRLTDAESLDVAGPGPVPGLGAGWAGLREPDATFFSPLAALAGAVDFAINPPWQRLGSRARGCFRAQGTNHPPTAELFG